MTLNNRILHVLTLAVLLVINSCYILSQTPKYYFEYLTPNDGLSQASVKQIVQDNEGFMWFGTRNGLNRYDGYEFKRYYHSVNDSKSLSGDLIYVLYTDSHGNLWVGTQNGFGMYNKVEDNFINYNLKSNYPESFKGYSIGAFIEDNDGNYWIGNYGGGVARYNIKTDTYEVYVNNPSDQSSISSNYIHAIIADKDNNIWIGTDVAGLCLYDREKNNFIRFVHDDKTPESLSYNSIWAMAKDKDDNIWLGTLGNGICKLIKTGKQTCRFESYKPQTTNQNRFKVLSICCDRNKNVWIGTENGGLDFFDTKTHQFVNFSADENSFFGLNSNSVQSVYEDSIGNLWVGTYTGGINVNKRYRKQFDTYKKIPGNPNSLTNNAVTCFYEDIDKTLWVGTDGGGLNIIELKTGKYKSFTTENSSLKSNAILAVCSDKYNNIWVGGWGTGLNRYNRQTKKLENLTNSKYGLWHINIFDIYADDEGILWISFGGVGLGRFDYKNNTLEYFTHINSELPVDWIFDIAEDKQGNLILCHSEGFSLFDPKTRKFTNFAWEQNNINSLCNNQVTTALATSDTAIWIGTSGGLNLFNPVKKQFYRFFTENGLPNNSIAGLVEDNHGNIWISTNDGISLYDIHKKSFRNYNIADGLQGKGFINLSYLKLKDGRIAFGGTEGFNIFHPDSLSGNPIPPKLALTSFSIFNKAILPGDIKSPFKCQINECSEIKLSHKMSVISFVFSAIEYTAPNQNQYKYKLDGFDENWNEVGTNRTATYTNLDPGKYTLKVLASNNDGIWTTHEKELSIIITPPFWKTIWFQVLITLVIFTIVFYAIRRRINSFKEMNELLEQKVNIRTDELNRRTSELEETTKQLEIKQKKINQQNEELYAHRNELELLIEKRTHELTEALIQAEESDRLKSSFLANMSHEIRTPMNAIIGFSSMLNNNELTFEEMEEYIGIINKNGESLLMLIDDIIDISKIQSNQILLKPISVNLQALLHELYNVFSKDTETKGLALKLESVNSANYSLVLDEYRLKQVLSNLILNAIKFTEKGTIEFGIFSIDTNITFFVKDTGIGIPEGAGDAVFERFMKLEEYKNVLYRGTGLGLAISKSLVELWKGQIWYESIEGKGTTFYFTHPVDVLKPDNSQRNILNAQKVVLPNLKGKRILVAEDEPDNFYLLKTILERTNAEIIWAKNGREAIYYADKENPDLIFMDIKMPDINGKEATMSIKKTKHDLPVVAQTAYTYKYEVDAIFNAGMDDYLEKPIKMFEINRVLRKFLS